MFFFVREAVITHEDIEKKKRNRSTWCKVYGWGYYTVRFINIYFIYLKNP